MDSAAEHSPLSGLGQVGAVCIELVELSRLARGFVLGDSIEGALVRVGHERVHEPEPWAFRARLWVGSDWGGGRMRWIPSPNRVLWRSRSVPARTDRPRSVLGMVVASFFGS